MAEKPNLIEAVARPVMGDRMSREEVLEQFDALHRCIQSAFISGVVMPIIRAMAIAYETGYYDARNENAAKTCAFLWDAFKKETGVDTPCLM